MPKTLTFPEFQASRTKCDDLDAHFGDSDLGAGFLYADGSCFITQMRKQPTAEYHLLIERSDWVSDDLEKLEKILWAMHYLPEQGGAMLSPDDGSLDTFVQGICAAYNRDVDGDLWGQVFSGVYTHIDNRAALKLMHGYLAHPPAPEEAPRPTQAKIVNLLNVLRKAETILKADRERAAREEREDTIGASVLALVTATIKEG